MSSFAIIVVGALVAVLLAWLVARTRLGMLIRAGASNRRMIGALGVNIELLLPTGMEGGKVSVAFGVDNAAAAQQALGELATASR